MKQLIANLLKDARLDLLMDTPEFMGARGRLINMFGDLCDGKALSNKNINYLHEIVNHIKHINPHFETLQVNGEDVPVYFVTDLG
jgi:hypothetical protein